MASIIADAANTVIVSVVLVVAGAFLFRGDERCFRFVPGGRRFLDGGPDEGARRKAVRWAALALWSAAALMVSAFAMSMAPDGPVRRALLALAVVFLVGFIAFAALQAKECKSMLG